MKKLLIAAVAAIASVAATAPASAFYGCGEYVLGSNYEVIQVCKPYNVRALSARVETRDVLFNSVFVEQTD